MYKVYLPWLGNDFWLRTTVWTVDPERANRFPTKEAAQAAIDKAAKFHPARQMKLAQIVTPYDKA